MIWQQLVVMLLAVDVVIQFFRWSVEIETSKRLKRLVASLESTDAEKMPASLLMVQHALQGQMKSNSIQTVLALGEQLHTRSAGTRAKKRKP